jgi:hypothetical protein
MRHGSANRVFCKRQATPNPGEVTENPTSQALRDNVSALPLATLRQHRNRPSKTAPNERAVVTPEHAAELDELTAHFCSRVRA